MKHNTQTQLNIPRSTYGNKTIIQSNVFTQARYEYNAVDLDIITCMLYKLKEKDFKETQITIPLAMLQKYSDGEVKRWHILESCQRLMKKQAKIIETDKNGQTSFKLMQFISAAELPHGSGQLFIEVPKAAIPYYQPLEKEFTIYQVEQSLGFKSKHTKRLYQILNQYKSMGVYTIDMTTLKELLGLINVDTRVEKFIMFNAFCQKVLDIAQLEMKVNESDIQFTYEIAAKHGKRITAIKFFIVHNAAKSVRVFKEDPLFSSLVNTYKVSEYQATEIVLNVSTELIRKVLYQINLDYKDGKVKNVGAYTATIFRNNYGLAYKVGDIPQKTTQTSPK